MNEPRRLLGHVASRQRTPVEYVMMGTKSRHPDGGCVLQIAMWRQQNALYDVDDSQGV